MNIGRAFIGLSLAIAAAGCVGPKTARCSNRGECKEFDDIYEYCVQGNCVECVGNSDCGLGHACKEGRCDPPK